MSLSPSNIQSLTSPKRKRTHEDSTPYAPQNSPSKPRNAGAFQTYPILLAQLAAGELPSQTAVTSKFQNLSIRGIPPPRNESPSQNDRKRLAAMDVHYDAPSKLLPNSPSPTDECTNSSIQPSSTSTFEFAAASTIVADLPRRRSRSPSLTGEPNDNFWHDSEITGHNPTDPADDGYGINGIGFKPTPAIAWARAQKRKQQLADYKSRETREARQRRIDRRRVHSNIESERENDAGDGTKSGRVRFEDA